MTEFHQQHTVRDGAFGLLHALFGIGVHHVRILDAGGQTVGEGSGSSEPAARQEAWKQVHELEQERRATN